MGSDDNEFGDEPFIGNDLFAAVRSHDVDNIKTALLLGADIDDANDHGDTALHVAAHLGNEEMINALIEGGAELDVRNKGSATALDEAVKAGNVVATKTLWEHGADYDRKNLMRFAVGHGEFSEKWIEVRQFEKNGKPMTEFTIALPEHVSLESIKELIAENLLLSGDEVPEITTEKKRCGAIDILEDRKAIIEFLCDQGVSVDSDDSMPLFDAISGGRTTLVKTLLELGADPNGRYGKNRTPVFLAAEDGLVDIVETLIEHGADVNAVDGSGKTPLASVEELAEHYQDDSMKRVADLLIRYGATLSGKARTERSNSSDSPTPDRTRSV